MLNEPTQEKGNSPDSLVDSGVGYWVLCNTWIWPLSIHGWVGSWVQEQKAEPPLCPSHPLLLPVGTELRSHNSAPQ